MSEARRLEIAVYGLINAGKSSLINALGAADPRPTGPIGGTTREVADTAWVPASGQVGGFDLRLVDTPGLEEVGDAAGERLATEAARDADLILFVVAEDLTESAMDALTVLRDCAKPMIVVLNKVDLLGPEEERGILDAIRRRLEGVVAPEDVIPISAAPIVRERVGQAVSVRRGEPRVDLLRARLVAAIDESGDDLKSLNGARGQVEDFVRTRESELAGLRARAERVADETSLALAAALAVNPVPLVDFLTGPGGIALLVFRVAAVYGVRPSPAAAKGLAGDLLQGGRKVLWGSVAAVFAGGAMKLVPGLGHLTGAITQGAAAGYIGHVLGRALVDYYENDQDWGDLGLVARLDEIAARADRKAITRGLVGRLKARLRSPRGRADGLG